MKAGGVGDRSSRCAGLLARKLRTVLTGFAVVIGVAFVVGTFVFTDTIDASFKDLFERTSEGRRRLRRRRSSRSRPTSRRRRPMPADTLEKVKAVPRRRGGRGQRLDDDVHALRQAGQADRRQRPADDRSFSSGEERFDPLDYVEGGRAADGRTRSRSTEAPPTRTASRSATRSRSPADAPAKQYKVSGIATLGDQTTSPASRSSSMHAARGAADRPATTATTSISVAADGGTTPEQLKARDRAGARAATSTCAPARRQAEKQAAGHLRRARLHPDGAARVRRRRACSSAAS